MPLIPANGLAFHVQQQGQGAPIVLLHGFTGSSESWQPVAERLSRQHQTIAVDLIGHGATAAPPDAARYAFDSALDDLAALAANLNIERATWLGYSMGGRLALGLALNYPGLVSSLILESASPGLAADAERAARRASDESLADRIEEIGVARFVAEWERLPLWECQRAVPEAARRRQREIRLANSPVGLANSLRGMGQGMQPSFWDRLGQIAAPTLLIVGELDLRCGELAAKMQAAIPQSTLAVVPGAGHAVHLEQPRFFAEWVLQFMAARSHTISVAREEATSWT